MGSQAQDQLDTSVIEDIPSNCEVMEVDRSDDSEPGEKLMWSE